MVDTFLIERDAGVLEALRRLDTGEWAEYRRAAANLSADRRKAPR